MTLEALNSGATMPTVLHCIAKRFAQGSDPDTGVRKMSRAKSAHLAADDVILIFTVQGTAELVNAANDDIEWASDEDEDFRAEQPNEFLGENDAGAVIDYLVGEGYLDEDEKGDVEIEVESAEDEDEDEDDE
jgi:hypothetical protein